MSLMDKIEAAKDGRSLPNSALTELGKISTVEEATRLFGPEFIANFAAMLAPHMQRLQQGNVKKVYEVEDYKGSHVVMELIRTPLMDPDGEQVLDKDGKKKFHFVERKREVKGGWMVYLPQGHSIYVETLDQLQRLRLDAPSGMVDMNTGHNFSDAVESIKEKVHRNTQSTPRGRRSGDGSMAGDIDGLLKMDGVE